MNCSNERLCPFTGTTSTTIIRMFSWAAYWIPSLCVTDWTYKVDSMHQGHNCLHQFLRIVAIESGLKHSFLSNMITNTPLQRRQLSVSLYNTGVYGDGYQTSPEAERRPTEPRGSLSSSVAAPKLLCLSHEKKSPPSREPAESQWYCSKWEQKPRRRERSTGWRHYSSLGKSLCVIGVKLVRMSQEKGDDIARRKRRRLMGQLTRLSQRVFW